MAAGNDVRALREGGGDMFVHLGGDALVVQRAHRRGIVEGIAEPDLVDRTGEPVDKGILEIALDQDPLAGGATLSGAEEAADDNALDRAVGGGVVEDDDRAVA